MSEIITCPSGLSGRIRGMKVREERVLADRRLAKSGGQVDELLAACWEETLDAGPYDFGEKPIDASARISIAFGKGPKATTNEHNFAYWIAVTRVNREVIEKREFIVPIKFGSEEAVERVSHEIEKIIIPRKDDTISGSNFEVVVGLVVTPEQAIFNRSGKSLKFPELNAAD